MTIVQICGDGRVELVGGSSRCGGGFMGLAHILTGAQVMTSHRHARTSVLLYG